MKKMMRMFTEKDAELEFQMFITTVNKNDELKAKEFENRSTYVNPSSLRIEYSANKKKAFYRPEYKEYCPI